MAFERALLPASLQVPHLRAPACSVGGGAGPRQGRRGRLLGVPWGACSGYGRSFRGSGAGSTDAHRWACYRSSMRITIRPSSFFIRDPEARTGPMVPAFAAALSVRINDTLRVMAPWWVRAVLMYLSQTRASVSEIRVFCLGGVGFKTSCLLYVGWAVAVQ